MNIICKTQDKTGTTWGVDVANNTFTIVYKDPKSFGGRYWNVTSEKYNDPDPAIKALKKRVAEINEIDMEA